MPAQVKPGLCEPRESAADGQELSGCKEGKRDLLNERIEGNKKPVPILGPLQVLKVMWALDKIQFVSGMLGKALSECPPDKLVPEQASKLLFLNTCYQPPQPEAPVRPQRSPLPVCLFQRGEWDTYSRKD